MQQKKSGRKAVVRTSSAAEPAPPSVRPAAHQTVTVTRQGPIPAPQDLLEYDQLMPGLGDRIVAMAERQQAHEINVHDMTVRADIRHRDDVVSAQRDGAKWAFLSDALGQVLGWMIASAALAGAIYTGTHGAHWSVSVALVSLPVAAIIKAVRAYGNGPKGNAKK